MPAISASDQVLMFPIEIEPLFTACRGHPKDPAIGGLVPELKAPGPPKCEIPTGQPQPSRARLALLVADLIYGRRDRSELIGGGRRHQTPAMADPPRDQPLAERGSVPHAARGVGCPESA